MREWNVYTAKGGTVFNYDDQLRLVGIMSPRSEGGMVPLRDVEQFMEEIYHGSEIPTAKEE